MNRINFIKLMFFRWRNRKNLRRRLIRYRAFPVRANGLSIYNHGEFSSKKSLLIDWPIGC